jgi:CBS domain-containing membrane protein
MQYLNSAIRLFYPALAGATLPDRIKASFGAFICLVAASIGCALLSKSTGGLALLVAPMGASAVLLFAVPASPLAQPWSIFGGNVVSAAVGVAVASVLGHTAVAIGAAVGAAILAMSLLRCIHPPGGAAAITAVIGGPAIWGAGFAFPFNTVAVDTIILLMTGWLFHRFSGHSYPHRAPAAFDNGPHHLHRSDITQALGDIGETFDISADDLEALLERAEHYALLRTRGPQAVAGS